MTLQEAQAAYNQAEANYQSAAMKAFGAAGAAAASQKVYADALAQVQSTEGQKARQDGAASAEANSAAGLALVARTNAFFDLAVAQANLGFIAT